MIFQILEFLISISLLKLVIDYYKKSNIRQKINDTVRDVESNISDSDDIFDHIEDLRTIKTSTDSIKIDRILTDGDLDAIKDAVGDRVVIKDSVVMNSFNGEEKEDVIGIQDTVWAESHKTKVFGMPVEELYREYGIEPEDIITIDKYELERMVESVNSMKQMLRGMEERVA